MGPIAVTVRGRRVWATLGGVRVRVVPAIGDGEDGPVVVWRLWGTWDARTAWRLAAEARGVGLGWRDQVDLGPVGTQILQRWGADLATVAAWQRQREAGRLPPVPNPLEALDAGPGPDGLWERLTEPDADFRVTWPELVTGRTVVWTGQVQHHGHRLTLRYHTAGAGVWRLVVAASGLRWYDAQDRPRRLLTPTEGAALWSVWNRAAWWGGSRQWERWAWHLLGILGDNEVWDADACRDPAVGYHATGPVSGWQIHLQEAPDRPPPDEVEYEVADDARGVGDTWIWRVGEAEASVTCWPSGEVWADGALTRVWVVAETEDVWADI